MAELMELGERSQRAIYEHQHGLNTVNNSKWNKALLDGEQPIKTVVLEKHRHKLAEP